MIDNAIIIGSLLVGIAVLLWIVARVRRIIGHHSPVVQNWERGALYRDGRFVRLLPPGRYTDWTFGRQYVQTHRDGPTYVSLGPLDVLSSDRMPYRLQTHAEFEVTDTRLWLENEGYFALRLAVEGCLRQTASTRTLSAMMDEVGDMGAIAGALPDDQARGFRVLGILGASLILPPEIRRLFSEVERGRLEGLAALERARGEQASLRALNNAARLLKGNPELMNLRLLQAVQSTGKGGNTIVVGQGGLLPFGGNKMVDKDDGPSQH